MDAVKYIKEKDRMCKSSLCRNCPISADNNGEDIHCSEFTLKCTEKTVELVEKWSEENPPEIDWLKVPPGTRVIVGAKNTGVTAANFALYLPKAPMLKFVTYSVQEERHRVVEKEEADCLTYWSHCELDQSVDPTPYYK
jgi:hypothetical protein